MPGPELSYLENLSGYKGLQRCVLKMAARIGSESGVTPYPVLKVTIGIFCGLNDVLKGSP